MNESDFLALVDRAVLRVTADIGRIGHLVCTQSRSKNEPTIREPEMRTAFQQEAEASGVFYGIEVPTKHTYSFKGKSRRKALIDLAFLTSPIETDRDVIVEFKEGQPSGGLTGDSDELDYPTITKDVHKLWAEPARSGRCMFHICQAANAGTLPAVISKYNAVTLSAKRSASITISDHKGRANEYGGGWFILYVFVLRGRGTSLGSSLQRYRWSGTEWELERKAELVPSI